MSTTTQIRATALLACWMAGLTGSAAAPQRHPAVKRPNLVLIYTDDQRFDAVAANGNPLIRTPNLDRLMQRGVRFENAYVVMSLCSPSRAAAMTGRFGSANGVSSLGKSLAPGERTFGHLLKDVGYRSGFVGKWHVGNPAGESGFDFHCSFHGNGAYFGRQVSDNGRKVRPEGHLDEYCVQRSIAFLEDATKGDRPFVLFHATQLPHMDHRLSWPSAPQVRKRYENDRLPLPATWEGDLSGKPPYLANVRNRTQAEKYGYDRPEAIRKHTGDYYAVVTELDAMLGQLFDAMTRLDLWDNTWVVFMSDNGWLLGEHRFTSKVLPYDPSARVPMCVVGPGLKPRTEKAIALNIDIAPTLLELAGVDIPKNMHGRSLVPLLRDPDTPWRKSFIYECLGGYGGTRPMLAACDGRWKLIHTYNNPSAARLQNPSFIELYDLETDVDETKNLAESPKTQEIRKRLAKEIDNHIVQVLAAAKPVKTPVKEEGPAVFGKDAPQFSGIYPHLAYFSNAGECGTGAVVPWADRLWVITYSPHRPRGSDDKLYEITPDLKRMTRQESVGGTPANRMIHRESQQLIIGPYFIDANRKVRVVSPTVMPGRHTGNARHLTEPAKKVYFATMEEGFYEVDVDSLAVTTLYPDNQGQIRGNQGDGKMAELPGYHGKGLYSGQGRLVYANNGEPSGAARSRPDIPSGCLAEWNGKDWNVVRRNQFNEVSGPGGISGSAHPDTDPLWSVGWDHRSLFLMLLDKGKWHTFRLPKATHTYDGAHGWNTEWPRIREIGEDDLLMNMHGMFWRFPKTFCLANSAGIAPRSTYLKIVGDFCRWDDRLVFGCDDAAKSEFINKRHSKEGLAGPGQSQSNLWFVDPKQLDQLGTPIARGAVWIDDQVKKGEVSDPFLFDGFQHRAVHLVHDAKQPVTFRLEVDRKGNDQWESLREMAVPAGEYRFVEFPPGQAGVWVRVSTDEDCRATAWFEFRNADERPTSPDARFQGLANAADKTARGGLVRAGTKEIGFQILATEVERGKSQTAGYYELGSDLVFRRVESKEKEAWMTKNVALPKEAFEYEGNSVLYVDQQGNRFRLPIGNPVYSRRPELLQIQRPHREVCTERDLLQCAGTFFELPAKNAGGFAKIRPVATHPYFVQDFCSWRGMMVLSGVASQAADSEHILRSEDGQAAVWLGTIDDLWSLGKATGRGGPWTDSKVAADKPSDPYLMAGYDHKSVTLSHTTDRPVTFRVEVDITGTGSWQTYKAIDVPPGKKAAHRFPDTFAAYWVRFVPSADTTATVELIYD